MSICEGILNGLDNDIEDYVEVQDRMEKDMKWIQRIKQQDAPNYEAALFNITQDAFRKAEKADDEFKRLLAIFMITTMSPWTCYNSEECENWDERQYCQSQFEYDDRDINMLGAKSNDYRWCWTGSNSFYHYFWDGDYIHSLNQEELLTDKKTQQFSKKLQDIASKYGLRLKPIF